MWSRSTNLLFLAFQSPNTDDGMKEGVWFIGLCSVHCSSEGRVQSNAGKLEINYLLGCGRACECMHGEGLFYLMKRHV